MAEKKNLSQITNIVNSLGNNDRLYVYANGVDAVVTGQYIPTLNNGKLSPSVLPSLATTEVFTVSSQSEMLALNAQVGDVCRRTDLSDTFILANSDPTLLENWLEWLTPPGIQSFNGRTTPAIIPQSGDYTTAMVTEVTNLYFTNARAVSALQNTSPTFANITATGSIYAPKLSVATAGGSGAIIPTGIFNVGMGNNDVNATGGAAQVTFTYNNFGSFAHYLQSSHSTAAGTNNWLRLYLNSSNTAAGSSAPGTGNRLSLEVNGSGGSLPGAWSTDTLTTGWRYLNSDGVGTVYDSGGNKRTGLQKVSGNQMCLVTNNQNSSVIKLGYQNNTDITAGTVFTAVQEWNAVDNAYYPTTNNTGSFGKTSRYWANAYITNISTSSLLQNLPISAPADATVGTTAGNAMLYTNSTYSSLLAKVRTSTGYNTITLSGATQPLTTYRITPRDIQVFEVVAGNEIVWPVRYDSDGVYAIREAQTSSFITAIIINPRFLKDGANYQPSLLQIVYKVAAANYTSLTLSVYKYVYTTGQASPTETLVAGEVNMSTGATALVTIAGLDLSAITMDPSAIYVALIKGTPSSSTSKFYFYNARLQFTPAG